ncbi:1830_t:CDS:2, partial [Dentiscutata erythropus]
DNRMRSFNMKIFNNELPTLQKLKTRYSLIYKTDKCFRCDLLIEDQAHVFTCENNPSNLNNLKAMKLDEEGMHKNKDEILFLDIIMGLIS